MMVVSIGKDDRVKNFAAGDASPTGKIHRPSLICHVAKLIGYHHSFASWTIHTVLSFQIISMNKQEKT